MKVKSLVILLPSELFLRGFWELWGDNCRIHSMKVYLSSAFNSFREKTFLEISNCITENRSKCLIIYKNLLLMIISRHWFIPQLLRGIFWRVTLLKWTNSIMILFLKKSKDCYPRPQISRLGLKISKLFLRKDGRSKVKIFWPNLPIEDCQLSQDKGLLC